MKVILAKTTCN